MPDGESTVYDEVLYEGRSYFWTHPDHLAALAYVYGLDPQPVEHCRVLEIGCGDGANLIPMAYGLPHSEFFGIDLAGMPIANGQAFIQKLGLRNISLYRMDLMDCPGRFGLFDYIIAHGVYSWVPPQVQGGLLQICHDLLRPGGVAFVSYNTYPGFYIRQMLREMMLFHVERAPDPETKLSQARALCQLLMNARLKTDELDQLLKKELTSIHQRRRECLYHDDLAEVNRPVYFHQFVEQAGRHGLQYLAEAEYFMMQDGDLTETARATLRGLDDNRLLKEQYLDFIRGRRFRQTLLCLQEAPVQSRPVRERIRQLRIDSSASSVSATVDLTSAAEETFRGTNDATMTCGHPIAKAVMLTLIEAWPRSLAFRELVAGIETRLGTPPTGEIEDPVTDVLWAAYRLGLVELHAHEPHFTLEAGERPSASLVARLQAEKSELLTNLRHQAVRFEDPRDRQLIQMLDGTKDRMELARELTKDGGSADDLDELLSEFGRVALLL